MIRKVAEFLFSLYGFAIFLIFMFLLFPFFVLVSFLPFPANGNWVYKLARCWSRAFFFFTFIRYEEVNENFLKKEETYVIISNHISYIDIPMMLLASKGHPVRILGKAEMSKIPLFGFIYRRGAVLVRRGSPEDRKKSMEDLKSVIRNHISVLICPEGTFNETSLPMKEFYDGAFRIAIELQKPLLPVLFPDTTRRLNYKSIFSLRPGRCRAVFLPEISAEGLTMDDLLELKAKAHQIMSEEMLKLNP